MERIDSTWIQDRAYDFKLSSSIAWTAMSTLNPSLYLLAQFMFLKIAVLCGKRYVYIIETRMCEIPRRVTLISFLPPAVPTTTSAPGPCEPPSRDL